MDEYWLKYKTLFLSIFQQGFLDGGNKHLLNTIKNDML